MGTRYHQLAMFLVYDSPLQIFSGNPSQGLKEPEFMELLGSIPTTWDETKILQGKVGEFIITARRKGNDWFIAGLNNSSARDIVLSLDLIGQGNFEMTLCKYGVNAHNYGGDHEIKTKTIQQGEKLDIIMAPGGGFLARLIKK